MSYYKTPAELEAGLHALKSRLENQPLCGKDVEQIQWFLKTQCSNSNNGNNLTLLMQLMQQEIASAKTQTQTQLGSSN
jgi:hypothetical protein